MSEIELVLELLEGWDIEGAIIDNFASKSHNAFSLSTYLPTCKYFVFSHCRCNIYSSL